MNQTEQILYLLAYQIDLRQNRGSGRVTAVFPCAMAPAPRSTARIPSDYVILDGVKGAGRYVGTFLAWTQLDRMAGSAKGEVKFFIDGDKKFPTICGTGTEDYFGASYGFPQAYTTAYQGSTLKAVPKEAGHPSGACIVGTLWIRSISRAICG